MYTCRCIHYSSIHSSIYLSIHSSIHPFIYLSIYSSSIHSSVIIISLLDVCYGVVPPLKRGDRFIDPINTFLVKECVLGVQKVQHCNRRPKHKGTKLTKSNSLKSCYRCGGPHKAIVQDSEWCIW